MKKTILPTLTLAVAAIFFAACDTKEGPDAIGGSAVDSAIEEAFRTRYPGVTRVEWSVRDEYRVANFDRDAVGAEAWFDRRGGWRMTETDIRYSDLPQAVRTAFERSEYASWRVDDVDMLEHPDRETVYVIEVEQGRAECDLYYTADGVLGKTVPENPNGSAGTGTGTGNGNNADTGGHTPSSVLPAIKAFIENRYPGARIVDVEKEHGSIEVDIVDGLTRREVIFTAAGEWTRTETDLRVADIPSAVMNALRASEYGSWRVDDVEMRESPDSETVYVIEVESGRAECHLYFTVDGVLGKIVPEGGNPGGGNTPGTNDNNGNGNGSDNGNNNGNGGNGNASPDVMTTVKAFIESRYPGARIVDVETERNSIEVDIVDGARKREAIFTRTGEWTRTETDLRTADVPAAVMGALAASQYGSWRVDDVDHLDTPTGEYYLFELEKKGQRDARLKIDPAGNIL